MGAEAYRFVDWLAAAGQSWWQVLPLGPPDRWGSPYRSRSAFAGSPALLADPRAPVTRAEREDFRERNSFWASDWERAARRPGALADQVRFEREWLALRRHAQQSGVALIGDLPLYVAPDSVDRAAHPRLFSSRLVAGAPPDEFNPRGQRWGNPVYDWPAMRRRGYRWWVERMRRSRELFDLTRIDHFRGLVAYWALPRDARDAREGRWHRGPMDAPLLAAARELGPLALVAEDLGAITAPVEHLRERLRIPGMAVLQFVLGTGSASAGALQRACEGRLLYTSTHDTETLAGWWQQLSPQSREPAAQALADSALDGRRGPWSLIRLAMRSPAPLVMMQAQDVLGLAAGARMNTPGRASGNWSWRVDERALDARLARRLRSATDEGGRLP